MIGENMEILTPKMIIDTIKDLPGSYRLVFNLHAIDRLSLEEISSRLNISIDTVSYNLQSARDQLKKSFERLGVRHDCNAFPAGNVNRKRLQLTK